jgi:hypothetical protein
VCSGVGAGQPRVPAAIGRAELAFLAVASQRRANERRTTRITAMLTHLDSWLPRLIDALAELPGAEYPRRLTTFARAVVSADLRQRGASAMPDPHRAGRA